MTGWGMCGIGVHCATSIPPLSYFLWAFLLALEEETALPHKNSESGVFSAKIMPWDDVMS
jgi:hypothetical protein